MNKFSKKNISSLFKIIVSLGLVFVLLRKIGTAQVYQVLKEAKVTILLLTFLLTLVSLVLQSLRLKILIQTQEVKISLAKILRFAFMSNFFGIFLPTVVGGDLFKIGFLGSYSGKRSASAATVLIDRLIGVCALLLVGFASFLVGFRLLDETVKYFIASVFILGLFSMFILYYKRLWIFMGKKLKFVIPKVWFRKAKGFFEALHSFKKHKEALYKAMIISFIYYFVVIYANYSAALALGLSINLLIFFIFVPLLALSGMIPISVSGLGVRETVSVIFFSTLGIEPQYGILLSLIPFLMKVILSLIGGVFYLTGIVFNKQA